MNIEQLSAVIQALNADDAAYVVVEAIIRIGQHGREAGESIVGHVQGLSDRDASDFEEGSAWVAPVVA